MYAEHLCSARCLYVYYIDRDAKKGPHGPFLFIHFHTFTTPHGRLCILYIHLRVAYLCNCVYLRPYACIDETEHLIFLCIKENNNMRYVMQLNLRTATICIEIKWNFSKKQIVL